MASHGQYFKVLFIAISLGALAAKGEAVKTVETPPAMIEQLDSHGNTEFIWLRSDLNQSLIHSLEQARIENTYATAHKALQQNQSEKQHSFECTDCQLANTTPSIKPKLELDTVLGGKIGVGKIRSNTWKVYRAYYEIPEQFFDERIQSPDRSLRVFAGAASNSAKDYDRLTSMMHAKKFQWGVGINYRLVIPNK